MARIALLYGGRSGEHDVSRASAAFVLKNLHPSHEPVLIGIDASGTWFLQVIPAENLTALPVHKDESQQVHVVPGVGLTAANGASLHIDAVLPILHGSYGEDGAVQGLLESARIPYAGSGILGSAVGMDKDISKRLWARAGLPVVPWRTFRKENGINEKEAMSLFTELGNTVFVKPSNAGSSVGVNRATNPKELVEALHHAWKFDRKVLVEQAIEGRELECSVLETPQGLQAFPPGEIIPANSHSFYDYEAKYLDPNGAHLAVPAALDADMAQTLPLLAQRAFRCVEAAGFSRVDFLVDDQNHSIYINEINTLPGMTAISLFPLMAEAGGVPATEMIDHLITGAINESAYREERNYTTGL